MKFTLLFYTDNWETGPVVELNHIPPPGSVVWTAGRRSDEEGAMYYVDNVMYPEVGLDDGDAVYLYVRPYTGYSRYAPMTETDRLASKLAGIKESLDAVVGLLRESHGDNAALRETVAAMSREVAMLRGELHHAVSDGSEQRTQVIQAADALEDGIQEQVERLGDVLLALEEIKARLTDDMP